MLAFLIDRCVAEAADLPQLVRLNDLMRAEDAAPAVPAKVAAPPPPPVDASYTLPALPPPPAVPPPVAPPAVKTEAKAGARPQPSRDPTALGFLLDRCVAGEEERAQCAVLQQLHGWLLADLQAPGNNNAVEPNLPPVPPLPTPQAQATCEVAASRPNACGRSSEAAAAPPPPPAVMTIPVPILPGAGDWKGSITVAAPPPPPRLATPTREEAEESSALQTRRSTLPAKPLDLHAYEDTAVEHDGLAADATSETTSPSARPPARPVPPQIAAYAGRMPRPASEALAARNSATVRLLSGAALGGLSSPVPVSRPSSAFARRFMAGLYERVTTPRGDGGGGSSAASAQSLQPAALYHDHHQQLPPFAVATGSGVRAARDRRVSALDPPGQHVLAGEQWRASPTAGRPTRPSSALTRAVLAAQANRTTRPLHRSPAPPSGPVHISAVGLQGSVVRRQPRHVPHPPAPAPSSAAATAVSPPHPPPRPSPASQSTPQRRSGSVSPAAVTDGALTGLVVVGARICLPSVALTRTRYA